ncbi:hypothetical protein C8R43DRAFT_1116886 [Mycena crocata]|nr:hypothetical protein C8R43DRAFT_1116886 [Mycena crocata]
MSHITTLILREFESVPGIPIEACSILLLAISFYSRTEYFWGDNHTWGSLHRLTAAFKVPNLEYLELMELFHTEYPDSDMPSANLLNRSPFPELKGLRLENTILTTQQARTASEYHKSPANYRARYSDEEVDLPWPLLRSLEVDPTGIPRWLASFFFPSAHLSD